MPSLDIRPFDASVISTIPDRAGNAGAAIGQGLSLANLMNKTKLDKLALSQAEEGQAKQADAERILKGADYSTPQGRWAAASTLTAAGHPQVAQQVLKVTSDYATGEYQRHMQQLDEAQAEMGAIASGFYSVKAQVDALKAVNPNITPQELDAHTRLAMLGAANQLKSSNPGLTARINQTLANPQNTTYAGLTALEEKSSQTQKMLADHRADMELGIKQRTSQAQIAEARARTRAIQSGQSGGRYSIREPQTQAGQDLKDQFIGATGGRITYAQLRSLDFDELARRGATASSLVQGGLTYTGQTRAAGAIGQRAGSISVLENSIGGASDQVLSAMGKLSQSNIQAVNKALAAGRTQFGDPGQARYATAVQSLRNEYARVIAGGGQSTDSSRAEATKLLNTAQSPAQMRAVIDQIKRETAIVKAAASSAMTTSGSTAPPAPIPAGAASPSFASEADAAAAAAVGRIKSGQRITVGGVAGTWQ